jgi:hypothetical protein
VDWATCKTPSVEDIDDDSDHKEGCETEGWALLPGQRVRARIVGQQPWGVFAKIIGYLRTRVVFDVAPIVLLHEGRQPNCGGGGERHAG